MGAVLARTGNHYQGSLSVLGCTAWGYLEMRRYQNAFLYRWIRYGMQALTLQAAIVMIGLHAVRDF